MRVTADRLTYLSLGAGVQSTAMLILSSQGKCQKADVALFADTHDEPTWVYEHLERLKAWSPITIEVVSQGHLSADVLDRHKGQRTRFVPIPVWSENEGKSVLLRRQCTREYKIKPIERRVRELLGLAKGQRAAGRVTATALVGISLDEASRMKPSRTSWITNAYPLVDLGLRRGDCVRIIADAGLPAVKKSSCVFCPYHGDEYWRAMKRDYPQDFERAAAFDEGIRDMSKSKVRGRVYLHRSLTALREIDFDRQGRLWSDGYENECEAGCFL